MGTTPFNATSRSDMRDLAATLKAENRTLRRRLARVTAEKLSQESTITSLRQELTDARSAIDCVGPKPARKASPWVRG